MSSKKKDPPEPMEEKELPAQESELSLIHI